MQGKEYSRIHLLPQSWRIAKNGRAVAVMRIMDPKRRRVVTIDPSKDLMDRVKRLGYVRAVSVGGYICLAGLCACAYKLTNVGILLEPNGAAPGYTRGCIANYGLVLLALRA